MQTLLEREDSTAIVEIRWDAASNRVTLFLFHKPDGSMEAADIPADKVKDAFQHPFCYLPR